MKRREFITLLGGAAVSSSTSPFPAFAQTLDKPPRRIGVLGGSSPAASAKLTAAFQEGMRAHGYIEGRDFEREYGWAEGRLERLSGLAEQMVSFENRRDLGGHRASGGGRQRCHENSPDRVPDARRSRALGFDQERRAAGRQRDRPTAGGGGTSRKATRIGARSDPPRDQDRSGRESR